MNISVANSTAEYFDVNIFCACVSAWMNFWFWKKPRWGWFMYNIKFQKLKKRKSKKGLRWLPKSVGIRWENPRRVSGCPSCCFSFCFKATHFLQKDKGERERMRERERENSGWDCRGIRIGIYK
jgi:hypothetical protein